MHQKDLTTRQIVIRVALIVATNIAIKVIITKMLNRALNNMTTLDTLFDAEKSTQGLLDTQRATQARIAEATNRLVNPTGEIDMVGLIDSLNACEDCTDLDTCPEHTAVLRVLLFGEQSAGNNPT